MTKTLLAHITFVRFLVRVRTHVYGQFGWTSKHLLAHIALVLRSLSLRSFPKSSFFFSYLFVHFIIFIIFFFIIIVISSSSSSTTTKTSSSSSGGICKHNTGSSSSSSSSSSSPFNHRLHVHRALRMWILSSRHSV